MTAPFESSLMSRLLRIVGIINVIAGFVLAIVFQGLKVTLTEIAAAEYEHAPPPHGLDHITANIGSIGMLAGGAVGCLLFFAVAKILDRVEETHATMVQSARPNGAAGVTSAT